MSMQTRNNYHLQARPEDYTTTVGDLLKSLQSLPLDLPVVFLSPSYGTFGSEQPYRISSVIETTMPRMENKIEASSYEDEDTGEEIILEEETQVWPEWYGVVLQGA